MFKHYFETIENIEVAPVISLLIFFLFFVGLIIWVVKVDKKQIEKLKNLPLEGNDKSFGNINRHES